MKLDPNSEKPLHIQAEEVLRKLIESEEYKNGKLLPNEIHFAKQSTNWYSRDYWSEKKGMVQRL